MADRIRPGRVADEPWIIDADGHVVEPNDMWERFLPKRFQSAAPRLGVGPASRSESQRPVSKMMTIEGGWDPSRRLPDMDLDGIERAVLFPTLGTLIESVPDDDALVAMHRAVNDWMSEYCAFAPDRLIGAGAIPSISGAAALAEGRRCIDELGLRVLFRSPTLGRPGALPIHHPDFEPLWDYLESANITVVTHSGAPPGYCVERYPDGFMASHVIHFVNEAMMALTSFVLYGILERHPELRVGLVESGATWARALCHRLDEHVEKSTTLDVHYDLPPGTKLSMMPSEYFRRQCFVTCEEMEPGLVEMLSDFPDNVLFASDYPHPDGVFPGATQPLLSATQLSNDQRRRILRDNALRQYRLRENI